jgi:hypothetical protein
LIGDFSVLTIDLGAIGFGGESPFWIASETSSDDPFRHVDRRGARGTLAFPAFAWGPGEQESRPPMSTTTLTTTTTAE